MPRQDDRENSLRAIRSKLSLPAGISIRAWTEANFSAIQKLSSAEGWTSPRQRPDGALVSWRHSWPALVATDGTRVAGFVRALTDGEVTTYVAELLVDPQYRGRASVWHCLMHVTISVRIRGLICSRRLRSIL